MSVMRVIVLPSAPNTLLTALSGLVTFTFDLFTSKLGHGSPVLWASHLPIVSLLCPSVLDLGSGTGHMDRQTDGQTDSGGHSIMPHPMGEGHNNV